jgi:hypothetical protein
MFWICELCFFFCALDHAQGHLPSKNAVHTQLFVWGEQLPTHYCKLQYSTGTFRVRLYRLGRYP